MKVTIKVGDLEILTTSMLPEAHLVVTFSGSRWFGFRVAIKVKDTKQDTAVSVVSD